MQLQGQSGGPEHAKHLRAVVSAKVSEALRDIEEGFGGQTVLPVRTRTLTWPASTAWSQNRSRAWKPPRSWNGPRTPRNSATSARPQAGRNCYEIGEALDLLWAASANKESIVVEGYEYPQQLDWRPGMGRQPLN